MKLNLLVVGILNVVSVALFANENKVFFMSPANGASIKSPVKVVFGVTGMKVTIAGKPAVGTGHHHLFVNQPAMKAGEIIPADPTHLHFGKGQTDTELKLEPGTYKLTLQFADGEHKSYGEAMSSTIEIKVVK